MDDLKEEAKEVIDNNSEWYKNLQYEDIKVFIKDNINSASRSFVAIGYYLKYVKSNELYLADGYETIWDFAQSEFNFSQSWTSRCISINNRFSKDGNSPVISEQYRNFDKSQLSEMLTLPDQQLEQVNVNMTIAQIKGMKPAKKTYATSHKESEKVAPVQVETKLPELKPEVKTSYLKCAAYDFNKFGKGCTGCFYDNQDAGCPYDRIDYFAEIKRQEERTERFEVLKEMCDCLCRMMSYLLEKNNYNMDTIKNLSRDRQKFSFGFGDDGTGHSKYDGECINERYHVEEFHGSGKWSFEAGEVDQQIWNVNGREWHNKHPKSETRTIPDRSSDCPTDIHQCVRQEWGTEPTEQERGRKECEKCWKDWNKLHKPADDIPETVNDEPKIVGIISEFESNVDEIVIETIEPVILERECSNCNYNNMGPDEYHRGHLIKATEFPCNSCDNELNHWEPKIDSLVLDCYNSEEGWHKEIISHEPEKVEIIKADVIQIESEDMNDDKEENEIVDPEKYSCWDVDTEIDKLTEYLETFRKNNNTVPGRRKARMRYDAIVLLDKEMRKPRIVEEELVQPELPILKNNDQRKEFIDAYETWPIWIDQKETGERYYRYNFSEKIAMVVKVNLRHAHEGYKETKDYEFSAEQYYLLGVKSEWHTNGVVFIEDSGRTFYECSSNRSAVIDYLKYFQKAGAR